MFDLASDSRHEGDRHGINDKGLITRDRVVKKDSYWFYRSNWRTDEKMLHLVGTRMQQVKGESVNVLAFSNSGDVTLFINDREIATLKPNEVNVVLFKDVKLSKGVNTVTVKSGNLVKTCSWVRGNTSK
jgi:beta-galactosidase